MYMLVSVDDIIIISSSSVATDRLLEQVHIDFAVKDLGKLTYFHGIEVSQISDGILLTQHKYISDLLTRTNMHQGQRHRDSYDCHRKIVSTCWSQIIRC